MPDTADDTATSTTGEATAPYVFPFDVPAALGSLNDDALRALHVQVRDHAQSFAGRAPNEHNDESLAALRACRDLAAGIRTAMDAHTSAAAEVAASLAAIDQDLPPAPAPAPAPATTTAPTGTELATTITAADGDMAARLAAALLNLAGGDNALTASAERRRPPGVRAVAARNGGGVPAVPANAETPRYAAMVAASGAAGFAPGQDLATFADAAKLLSKQLELHPSLTAGRVKYRTGAPKRPITVYGGPDSGRVLTMTQYNRTPGVEFRRNYPDDLRVRDRDTDHGYAVAEHAASERRLPGGSLIESARIAVANGRSLTAAAGWCAPSETLYELCELETLDGILDAPEMQTTRGGWNIPTDGGPDFGTIFNALGSAGDTHLTEAEVIAEVAKVCTDIPCPPFEETRLGVDYYCLTGGMLQRRGYPEVIARWSRGSVVALAHKINQGFIAAIVAGSGVATVINQDPNGDDAASSILSAVDLAVMDAKYRNRMAFNSTLEVVLPRWAIVPIRAGLARRTGVAMLSVTDAQIMEWFAERGAVVRFVYDWQDNFSGLVGGPGGPSALAAMPLTVQFLVYPAGTWVKAVQDVVSLDTIYDSTRLATNEYTAVFAEDGWAALQMCPLSRLYTVNADPGGVVGCCSTVGS